jgi:hypothetical protein
MHGVSHAIGFLLTGFFVLHWLMLAQDKYGPADEESRGVRQRRSSYFYRGSVRGRKSNAEWFVESLLHGGASGRGGRGGSGRGAHELDGTRMIPPEWERWYPTRVKAHDHDNSGTTVKLSTADMINVRWDLPLCVCLELGLLTDLIVKDFILFWYNESISTEPQFPDDVRGVLQNVLGKLADTILSVNLPMFLLCDMTYVLRHHLRWFSELRERGRKRCVPPEAFDKMSQEDRNKIVLEEFLRAGHLHPACSITGAAKEDPRTIAYIRGVTSELLVRLLPEQDYQCAALRHLVREVLTCDVLVPALEGITPDVINNGILAALRAQAPAAAPANATGGSAGGSSSEAAEAHAHAHAHARQGGQGAAAEEEEQEEQEDNANRASESAKSLSEASELVKTPLVSESALRAQLEELRSSSRSHLEDIKSSCSVAFIQEASSEMRKEEAGRLMLELHGALTECVAAFTSNPEHKLGNDSGAARQLLRVLDLILAHGLGASDISTDSSQSKSADVCEPWWEFARHVSHLVPAASMSTEAVDSVVETLFLDVNEEEGEGEQEQGQGQGQEKDAGSAGEQQPKHGRRTSNMMGGARLLGMLKREFALSDTSTLDAEEGSAGTGTAASPRHRTHDLVKATIGRDSGLQRIKEAAAAAAAAAARKKTRRVDPERDILQPGRAWLAMMLKLKLLGEALSALLADKNWTALHYDEGAAVRSERLVPMAAALNGIDFDFSLDTFWQLAGKLKRRLDARGVKGSGQERLRRMRRALKDRLASALLNVASPAIGDGRAGGGAEVARARAIVALQERVGPIRASVASFTVRQDRGGIRAHNTYVQYVVQCQLTRRADGQVSSWRLFRRYSQFHDLHTALEKRFGHRFDDVVLPKKGGFSVFGSQNVSFINKRKAELEQYLELLLDHPAVCDSDEVLTFLSPLSQEDVNADGHVGSVHAAAASPLAAVPGAGAGAEAAPASASPSPAPAPAPASTTGGETPRRGRDEDSAQAQARTPPSARAKRGGTPPRTPPRPSTPPTQGDLQQQRKVGGKEPEIDPYELRIAEGHMFKLAEEVFEFHEMSLVRRNLISMTKSVASLLFQGTAHRWIKANYTRHASAELLAKTLGSVRDVLWPNGEWAEGEEEREPTPEELQQLRKNRQECLDEINAALPPAMLKVLGRGKALQSTSKLHEFLQHPSLVHNLVFTTLDLLLLRVFPDLPLQELHERKLDPSSLGLPLPAPAPPSTSSPGRARARGASAAPPPLLPAKVTPAAIVG